ncbi:MAG: response regulator [Aquaticitalea sp.]
MRLQNLLFFLFLKSILIFGQGVKSGTENDSILTELYHDQFESFLYIDAHKAHTYIDSLSMVSKTNRYPKSNYYYQYDLGALNFVEHHLQASKIHYHEAYKLAKNQNWNMEAITAKIWLANLNYFNQDLSLAETQYREVLKESSQIGFVNGIANAFYGLADIQENKKVALIFLIKVDSVYQHYNTISPVLANTYDYIGRIYLETFKNRALAKVYFLKALEVSKQTNYRSGMEYVMDELMKLDFNKDEYEKVYTYFNGLLANSIQQADTIAIARNLTKVAQWELYSNQLELAEHHYQTAFDYFVVLNDLTSQENVNLWLAEVYIKKNNPDKAQFYLDRIENVQISFRNTDFVEGIYKAQIEILIMNKDFQLALAKEQELDSLKSASRDQKNDEAFLALERKFQSKKKEQAIALLTSKNELAQQQKSSQKNLYLSIILVVALTALSFYALYRNRQKVNLKLEELDAFKSKFYVNISHEFRTPLTLLLGPIEKQLGEFNLEQEKRLELNLMRRNAQRLLSLVNQLLDLSKLESGQLKLHVCEGNLHDLLYALSAAFEYQAVLKHIDFIVDIQAPEQAWFDKDLMEKVVINLLSNAFKHSPEHGEIIFRAMASDKSVIITIQNEGHPLTKVQIEQIFNRYYQADVHSEGVGVGLSYVKELIGLSHGTISVQQYANGKIAFQVCLLTKREMFKSSEVSENDAHPQILPDSSYDVNASIGNESIDDDLPIVLLVEDNEDIRTFMTSSFKELYVIVEAGNGREGLKKALELIPDIIISDVMMPIMDGLELTSILKKDERTCHIPIILLTAKVEEADELMGLDLGADDYIIKPFKIKLLRSRVKNLLEQRNKLRERFSQELILKPKDIVITNLDVVFFEKIKTVLDEKLTESSFSVEDFSMAVGMSRMQLHRKLKALTGLTTTEFVREQRLKLATTLIGQSDINISEIGYMVGFNDHSYFAKCFKQAYGCTPSDYTPSKNK